MKRPDARSSISGRNLCSEGICRAASESALRRTLGWQSGGRIGDAGDKNIRGRRVDGNCASKGAAATQILVVVASVVSRENQGRAGAIEFGNECVGVSLLGRTTGDGVHEGEVG